jgi:ribosomal protein S18 acetylase RimI-like enzyme
MIVDVLGHHDGAVATRILEIQREAYLVESAIIRYEIPAVRASVDDITASPETFLGCDSGGKIAGVISYDARRQDVEICRLVVDPPQFGRGLGAALVDAVVREFGSSRAIYVSTGADNQPAIRLYEKQGFAVASVRTLGDGLRLVELRREPRAG